MSGRVWAYVGAVLGGAVSIAANVLHSYVPAFDVPAGWQPPAGAVVGAVFWPVALLVAVEILARVAWPAGARWVMLRFGGLLPVAVVAAVVSYRHMSGLLAWYREDPLTVAIGPLAVDGLMVMAAGALLATSRRQTPEAQPVVVPAAAPASAQVSVEIAAPELPDTVPPALAEPPAAASEAAKGRKPARPAPPKRPFALTQQAAASMEAGGMTVAQIAAALGVSERQVRNALRPVPVDQAG